MKVLAICAHPDDIEVSCAGTLAKYVKRGDNVTICHVANGNMGHVVIEPSELREIRIAEAKKAGELIGIKVITTDIGDLLPNGSDLSQRDKLIEMIRVEKPNMIITHSPTDYMPDHVAVSKLVFDATFCASIPHYGRNPAVGLTPLFYMDNLAGMSFQPTEYVDITDTFELKLQMLECHVSQMKWMREHDGIDFADFVRTCAKFRGYQSNCTYAEAFTQASVWPKVVAKRMLP